MTRVVLLLLVIIAFSSCRPTEYGKITKELIALLECDPALKSMLTSSIERARQTNPDPSTNPVQSLEAYFDFISRCETSMPWSLYKDNDHIEVYSDISKSLRYFYFLINQPLPELEGKGYFNNSLQYAEPFASWLVKFSKEWGKYLSSEDSWNEDFYQLALQDTLFGLDKGWYEDPSNWKSFNDFFARHLRSPEKRPIHSPNDNSIVVSFADSSPQGVWSIDSTSMLVATEGIPIKSSTLKSIVSLIGEDSPYATEFSNGTFFHSFLAINDYHRYHFPLSGVVKEARIIQGINPSGGILNWDEENKRYAFDPSSIGWQMVETRGCVILDTEEFGLVALVPVGMATIGSVNFEEWIKPGIRVNKGDMLGCFKFGGSDFIMVFQEQVSLILDAPKRENSNSYKHLLMGELLGHLTHKE